MGTVAIFVLVGGWLFPPKAGDAAPTGGGASGDDDDDDDEASRGIPQIARASNREMLGQALNHLKGMGGTAAEKAAAFEGMAGQISRLSGGSWNAARTVGADGAHIFAGELGDAVVISPSGQVFLGNVAPAAGQFGIGAGGALRPIYDALRLVQ